MATYNSSQNMLNNEVQPGEVCLQAAPIRVHPASPLEIELTNLSIPNTAAENCTHGMHKNLVNLTQYMNPAENYALMEIKTEPCQVSEVTTSAGQHSRSRHRHKTMSTTTTSVKLESTSPKEQEMEKAISQIHTNNSAPVGTAGVKKWSQEPSTHGTYGQSQKELNYFGIRVADLATAGCGNVYFTGADFVSTENAEEINTSIHSANRSTFWQYPNSFPIDPVISMSPVGLQYSRDSSRGQLVLLPTTTAMESFPQATFMWPPYIPQTSGNTLSTSQNFIFPSMSPQPNLQPHSYAPHIQLLGTNYLTTAASATTSTFCQHSQVNRFVSISSDIKLLDQPQKEYEMKIDGYGNEYYNLCRSDQSTTNKTTKSKLENASNYVQLRTNAGFDCSVPILPNEPSHIMLESSAHPSEFINAPICMTTFTTPSISSSGRLQVTQDVTASIPLSPEMQDVNIQTDTPVCSEDEIFLELSTVDAVQYPELLDEKKKSGQFHAKFFEGKSLLRENSTVQMQSKNTVIFKESYFNQTEQKSFESEFTISDKSNNTNHNFSSNNPKSPIDIDCTSFKETNRSMPEMSGLELLSNISTGTFDNHTTLKDVFIKKEPYESSGDKEERVYVNETPYCNKEHFNMELTTAVGKNNLQNALHSSNNQVPLGGLNLLCALAEQRIQEEVQSNNYSKNSNETSSDTKRKKCKHAKLKSHRKSRYYKKNNKKRSNERNEYPERIALQSHSNKLHVNIKNTFKKIDSDYQKLSKWADPQQFFRAMESDMRMRLADITRQYKKKKRKLDEINKIKMWKKPSSSEYKFANISYKNPNIICFLEKFQKSSSNFSPSESIEKKADISTQNRKISGCVSDKVENNPESKREDHQSKHKTSLCTNNRMPQKIQCSERKSEKIPSKIKKKTNKKTQSLLQPNISVNPMNAVNTHITDSELKLSAEHLYCKETRVLTDMGGLFYAGILKPLQPPDVYSVTLDGERGNKSHIMSREEIIKDTILEVTPKSIDNVPTGTRLCAYWSQQYRCLYPGKAIDSEKCDKASEFVSVEFDDGDSGKIRLDNVRLLLSDYPIVEYSENPFNTLAKNKKTTCIKPLSVRKLNKVQNYEEIKTSSIEEETEFRNNDSKNISTLINQDFSSTSILNELDHKHRKHKKKKKSKKHLKSCLKLSAVFDNENKKLNKCDHGTKLANFDCNTIDDYGIKIITSQSDVKTSSEKTAKFEVIAANTSSVLLHDDCSTSTICNALTKRPDKSKNRQKVDSYNRRGSKIAAFLPERQIWSWHGHAYRRAGLKGRTRKSFYKSITRGKEVITVGECAVFLSTGRPDRPYIGRIESFWETNSNNKVVRVRWFYHPEETTGCPVLKYPGGLFVSPHEDENDVQTISHRCEVIEFPLYIAKFGSDFKQYQSVYDNNDTFYLSGYYNPRLQLLKLEPHVPIENTTSS